VIAVLATLAFVLLVALLLEMVLDAEPTRRLAIRWIERVADGYGAEVEIGDLHWGLFPPGIRLQDVSVRGAGVAAHLDSARVDIGRMWFTRRTLELSSVTARGVRLSLDGLPESSNRGEAQLKFKIRHLALDDVNFEGVNLPGKLTLNIENLRAGWFTEESESRGFAEVARASVRIGKMEPIVAAVRARYVLSDDGFDLSSYRIDGEGFEFLGDGQIASTGTQFNVRGPLDVGWLDKELRTNGLLDGEAQVSVTLDTTADAILQAFIRAPHLEAAGFPIDDVEGQLVLDGKNLRGTLSRARFHGGTIEGRYELGEFGGQYPHWVQLDGHGIILDSLLDNINVESAGLSAAIDLSLQGSWNGKALGAGTGHASVKLIGTPDGMPVDGNLEVDLIEDGLLRFDADSLALGSSSVMWQGALTLGTWEPAWTVRATPAALDEVAYLVNTWVGSTVLPEDLTGTGELQVNLNGPFNDLVVSGRVDAQPLVLAPVSFDRLVAEFTINRSLLRLGSARFQVAGGNGEVEGGLAWGEEAGEDQLNLDIRARQIPATAVASWIDLDQWVDGGRISFTGGLRGPLALPRGSWALGLNDLAVAGFDVGNASATIDLVDGQFTCHDLRADQGLVADFWWNVPDAEIGGSLSWPKMPLGIFGETIAHTAGDVADFHLDFDLPLEGGPTGTLTAVSEHANLQLQAEPETVVVEAHLAESADLQASLVRTSDGFLSGNGKIFVTSAQELLAHLVPESGVPLSGTAQASFEVAWGDEPVPQVEGLLEEIDLTLDERRVQLVEPARFRLSEDGFEVPGLRLRALEDEMFVRWMIDADGNLEGNLSGTIDTLLVRFLLPDWEPAGRAQGVIEFLGTTEEPEFEGIAEIQKGSFRLPGTRTILSQVEGIALLSIDEVRLEGMDFRFMGGRGHCNGTIRQRADNIVLNLDGTARGVDFEVLPNLNSRMSGNWRLRGPVDDLELSGDINVDRMTLGTKDDVATVLLSWFGGTSRAPGQGGLRLNLHVEAEETIDLRNPSVRLTGSAALEVTGTSNQPGLVGQIEVVEGGEATLPFIDLQATTWVQQFQVTVHITGTADRFVSRAVSTPPLSAPEIYSLLGVGTRRQDLGTSAVGLGLASSILTSELTSVLSRRGQMVLPIDQIRVDPFAETSTGNPTARLSVIKQLTPAWTVILQTTLSGEREQLVISRWYLSPGLFLEAAQHEDRSLSLDLKLRRPY
jgi:autotransporter translocation and assembly factor TamB